MPKTKFLSAMEGGIAFFTRIPIKTGEEEFSALTDNTFVFIIIGAIIGLLVGIFSSSISSITFINVELRAVLTIVFLYLLTGLLHIDGLADLFDGLMANKIEAMKDTKVGVGALASLVIYLIFLYIAIKNLKANLILAFLFVEMLAKISMLNLAFFGRSSHAGIARPFIEKTSRKDILISYILLVPFFYFFKAFFFFPVISVLFADLAILWVCDRYFGGIGGDVLGAGNEIGRLVALVVIGCMPF
ncbi:MAG: cobalamin synthase [Candidatus Methanolliviera sp. GoM_asphalt]|nr:MAG: cobalamin synthase [Candidatus Methanolliviera sp. GoM_asphalt]